MSQPPEIAHRLFEERFNAGDLEGMLALYEEPATFVRGPGDHVQDRAGLIDGLKAFLGTGGKLRLDTRYEDDDRINAMLNDPAIRRDVSKHEKPAQEAGDRTAEDDDKL